MRGSRAHEFRVNFGVQSGVSNQINNPLFGLLVCHVQFLSEHPC